MHLLNKSLTLYVIFSKFIPEMFCWINSTKYFLCEGKFENVICLYESLSPFILNGCRQRQCLTAWLKKSWIKLESSPVKTPNCAPYWGMIFRYSYYYVLVLKNFSPNQHFDNILLSISGNGAGHWCTLQLCTSRWHIWGGTRPRFYSLLAKLYPESTEENLSAL